MKTHAPRRFFATLAFLCAGRQQRAVKPLCDSEAAALPEPRQVRSQAGLHGCEGKPPHCDTLSAHTHRSAMNMLRTALAMGLATAAALAQAGGDAADGHSHGHGAGIGVPGKAAMASRTVHIDMTDTMRFHPSSVAARQGETIRFVVKNSGQARHEFVLGTETTLKEHYEAMKKFPEMEHADPNMVTVAPGKTGEVVWRFTRAGTVGFACLQPGHYDAGMKGTVTVTAGKVVAPRAGDGHADHRH